MVNSLAEKKIGIHARTVEGTEFVEVCGWDKIRDAPGFWNISAGTQVSEIRDWVWREIPPPEGYRWEK